MNIVVYCMGLVASASLLHLSFYAYTGKDADGIGIVEMVLGTIAACVGCAALPLAIVVALFELLTRGIVV